MTYIEFLQDAILKTHGCRSVHARTVPVHETFKGQTVWQGDVEVFELAGHPKARTGYAWGYTEDGQEMRAVAVLGLPPITDAQAAVQAFIVSEQKKA